MPADFVSELKTKGKNEPIAAFLGMRLLEMAPGYVKVAMLVKPEFLNFNGLVFGGIITSLADQAFAYAVNSVSHPSFATQLNIHFLAAPKVGDELIAEGKVIKSSRRVGIAEMTVTNQEGKLIARATGTTIPVTGTSG